MPKDRIKRYGRRVQPYKARRLRYPMVKTKSSMSPVMPLAIGRSPVYGFPSELVVRLKYCDVYTMTSTAGSLVKQVWRPNSVVDPDFTGAGHQPMYFDQLAALYSNYTVLGSKIEVLFSPIPDPIATAQPSGPFEIGLVSDPNGTTSSTASTLAETTGCKSTLLTIATGGNNVRRLVHTYSPEKDLGISADDDTAGASIAGSPSATWYWTAYMRDIGLSASSVVEIKVAIDYLVKFKRRDDIAGS